MSGDTTCLRETTGADGFDTVEHELRAVNEPIGAHLGNHLLCSVWNNPIDKQRLRYATFRNDIQHSAKPISME